MTTIENLRGMRTAPLVMRRLSATGTLGPGAVLLTMTIVYFMLRPSALSIDGITTIFNAATALAFAASAACIVTIVGGFDFSAGAALSVVNVVIATQIGVSTGSQLLMVPVALAAGCLIGLINGLLVARLRIASIVATLATSFLWGGVALLLLSQPGGAVPTEFASWFTGNIAGVLPAAVVGIAVVVYAWLILKRTRLGRAIYAVGGDIESARLNGIDVTKTIILAYVMAGFLYGLSGIFLTALTASGDPNIGGPLLLPIFAAIAIGGVRFGGGRGDMIGAIVGVFILYMISDLLFAFGVNSFYTSILNGVLLLVAVSLPALLGAIRSKRSARHATAQLSHAQKPLDGIHE